MHPVVTFFTLDGNTSGLTKISLCSAGTPFLGLSKRLDVLDAIRSQLRTVIQNQQESMLRQAIMIAQNREMLSQNQRLFEELSNMRHTVNHAQGNMETVLDGIRQSSAEAAQWAQMAALNAEICAWVNISEYIRE